MLKKAKNKFDNLSRSAKIQFVIAFVLTVLLIVTAPTLAWFSHKRSVSRLTEIKIPNTLHISSAHREDVINIDLGDINVQEEIDGKLVLSKDTVFCVAGGKDIKNYIIQLAYTTNIPFTYTIYKATELTEIPQDGNSDSYVAYVSDDNQTFYYQKGEEVKLTVLNDSNGDGIADSEGTEHNITYGDDSAENAYSSDYIQKNAEPIYKQSGVFNAVHDLSTGEFADYYILEVTWNESLKNEKETDMIYISAKESAS